jgi:hypothetical protein
MREMARTSVCSARTEPTRCSGVQDPVRACQAGSFAFCSPSLRSRETEREVQNPWFLLHTRLENDEPTR